MDPIAQPSGKRCVHRQFTPLPHPRGHNVSYPDPGTSKRANELLTRGLTTLAGAHPGGSQLLADLRQQRLSVEPGLLDQAHHVTVQALASPCCPNTRPSLNPGSSNPATVTWIDVDRSPTQLRSADGNDNHLIELATRRVESASSTIECAHEPPQISTGRLRPLMIGDGKLLNSFRETH